MKYPIGTIFMIAVTILVIMIMVTFIYEQFNEPTKSKCLEAAEMDYAFFDKIKCSTTIGRDCECQGYLCKENTCEKGDFFQFELK